MLAFQARQIDSERAILSICQIASVLLAFCAGFRRLVARCPASWSEVSASIHSPESRTSLTGPEPRETQTDLFLACSYAVSATQQQARRARRKLRAIASAGRTWIILRNLPSLERAVEGRGFVRDLSEVFQGVWKACQLWIFPRTRRSWSSNRSGCGAAGSAFRRRCKRSNAPFPSTSSE